MEIGAASPKDFAALVRLTSREGWNYTERDFAALWSTGCMENLVARDGKGVAGMVTVLDYGEVAWLSNVVVRGDVRGKGIGRALVGEAVSRNGGKRTISLLSYGDKAGFYRRQGFSEAGELGLIRFTGGVGGDAREGAGGADFALDEACFGYRRPRLLEMMAGEHRTLSPTRGRGFAFVRADPAEPMVGPVVADDREAGLGLLYAALGIGGAGCGAVTPQTGLAGTETVARVSRLYLGEKPLLDTGRVYALTGLELG